MTFKKVVVNDEVIDGEYVEKVLPPTPESQTWQISLKNNTVIEATGNISVWLYPNI